MTTCRLLPIALAAVIAAAGGASMAAAQPGSAGPANSGLRRPLFTLPSFLAPRIMRPPASKPSAARPAESNPAESPPIEFFVATGPANACGPGCDAWIAADGRIDLHAAQRLRKVLARLGSRQLPLLLHSPGGSVLGAIALGRLVRSRNLTVSVARTTPVDCRADTPRDKACETLMRAGQNLVSALDPSGAMCNSACVLVLAGGAQRSVPPWVRLGVHAIGLDPGKTAVHGPQLAADIRSANGRIVEFLHDMGIPKALFDASNAIPHESARFLRRDELVLFGLDTRDFGETDWRFAEKPAVAIAKGFFMHTGDADLAYPEALLRLTCSGGKSMRLTFARERPTPAIEDVGARPLRVNVNGVRVDLPYTVRSGKIEVRTATLRPEAIASDDDRGAIEISGFDAAGGGGLRDGGGQGGMWPDRIVLNMAGFSAAYAKLGKVCADTARADNDCSSGDLSPRCMPDAPKRWHPPLAASGGQAASPAP
jgi:hypothetical protein